MLKGRLAVTSAMMIAGLAFSAPAMAQYDAGASASMGASMGASNMGTGSLVIGHRAIDRQAHPKNPTNSQTTSNSTAIPDSVMDRTQNAAFAELNPEFNRRAAAYGRGSAQQWMSAAGRSVGQQIGALAPEYRRRVQSQGRAQADNWYVSQAHIVGQRYVANSRR